MYSFNTTVEQNKAHRDDLTWFKCGKSEYMRGDGVTLRKDNNSGRWYAFNEDGSAMLDKVHNHFPVSGHSLTWAKLEVAEND